MKKRKIVKVDLVKFLRSIFLLLVIFFIISLFIGKVIYSHGETKKVEFCVSKNETLWEIAEYQQENNDYYKNKNIPFIMNDIMKLNNMELSMVYEGQVLMINTY